MKIFNNIFHNIYILLFLFSSLAHSQCDVAFTDHEATQHTTPMYDVFNRSGLTHSFEIDIKRLDNRQEPCDIEIEINAHKGLVLYQQQQKLTFQLHLKQSNHKIKTNNRTLEYQFKADHQALTVSYQIYISPEQFIPAGIYQTELELKLKQAGIVANNTPIVKKVRVNIEVASAARISFAGTTGRHHKVSFGELVDGKKIYPAPAIIIQSSGRYGLEFSSKFRGALRHSNNNKQWDIPYQLTLNRKTINLKQEKSIWYNTATDKNGLFLPLDLSVPLVGERPTGRYRDILNISISPAEILF